MGKQVTDYLLYRWRYILGYAVIGLTVVGLLIVAALYIPGGLSKAEMNSTVMSNAIAFSFTSFDPNSIVNLPYHLLQRLSLTVFGVSTLSIKLPSLFLGLLSALGMLLLLKKWFRRNVAVITTILVITTGQFLFIAQNGTPSIVTIFWSIWLLVTATMISRNARFLGIWKILLFGAAALSLYTPLSIYVLVALASAIILHPHLRYIVRRLSKVKVLLAGFCALLLITPLIYVCIRHPSIALMLLGIPPHMPDIQANFFELATQYFNFLSPDNSIPMTPIYGLGSVILIALGILRMGTTKYTARSYIIVAWIILLLPVLIINPTFTSITFAPVLLLMAMGISMLVSNWYKLFPHNPYARIAGLIPLAILISGMVFSGVGRYMYGYLYNPQVSRNFSKDLRLVNAQLKAPDRGSTQLVVAANEVPFYTVVAKHHSNTTASSSPTSQAHTIIFSHDAHKQTPMPDPSRIITDGKSNDADRFYIYKTNSK